MHGRDLVAAKNAHIALGAEAVYSMVVTPGREVVAHWTCCGHVRGTDTAARTGIGSIVAGRPAYGSAFWVADRSDRWSVLAFDAKWIISGRQPVRCGNPGITNAYLWKICNLCIGLGGYRGTPIINLMHWLADAMAHSYCGTSYLQTAGGMVRTVPDRGERGVRHHPPGRTDQEPLPMFRCPGSPVFP